MTSLSSPRAPRKGAVISSPEIRNTMPSGMKPSRYRRTRGRRNNRRDQYRNPVCSFSAISSAVAALRLRRRMAAISASPRNLIDKNNGTVGMPERRKNQLVPIVNVLGHLSLVDGPHECMNTIRYNGSRNIL